MHFSHQNPKPSDIDKKNNSGDGESLKALRIDNNHGGSGATGNHRRKRKGIKKSHNRDLLSDMPDEILRRILSFLPTRQSARTSVLSRRWRHLWRYVPTLHFDIYDHPPVTGDAEIFVSGRKLVYVIDQFVTLRDTSSSLLRFRLRLHIHDYHLEDPISNWISYARSHGVRDMAVSISWLNPYPLGPPFYIFFDLPSVEALYLQNTYSIISDKLPQQIALSKLKVLTLDSDVEPISDQYLTMLLSSCPALQELTLTRGNYNKAVEITVPSLRRLSITYYDNYDNSCQVGITCPKLEYFHLSNWAHLKHFQDHMPSLLEASIHLYLWAEPVEYVQQIFVSLSGVTELTLHLTADKEEKRSPQNLLNQIIRCPIFHKMKHFTFKAYLKENYFKEALLDFLLLSPNLESLDLVDAPNGLDTKRYLASIVEGCMQQERIPRVLDHLKTVSVRGICNRRTRRDVLKMLSMHVSEWDRMVVIS